MSEIRSFNSRPAVAAPNHKRKLLFIGGGIGLIGVWYFFKARQDTSATVDDTGATDDGYSSIPDDTETVPPTLSSYVDPTTGATITNGTTTTQTITQATTNPAWAQQATAYLTQNGFDPVTVGIALGLYLSGRNLSNSQLQIVEAAIAAEGNPPTSVPAPHTAPPSGQSTGSGVTGTTTKPKAPVVHIASKRKGSATLAWGAVPGATHYRLYYKGVFARTITTTSNDVHRNGNWRVASVRGTYVSPHSNVVTVKGI